MSNEAASNSPLARLIGAARRAHAAIDALDAAIATHLAIGRNDLRCLNLLEAGTATPTEIGRRLDLSSGSVTALVDRLEAGGLARRVAGIADRRSRSVGLTPSAMARVGPLYRAFAQELQLRTQASVVGADTMADALGVLAEAVEAAIARVDR